MVVMCRSSSSTSATMPSSFPALPWLGISPFGPRAPRRRERTAGRKPSPEQDHAPTETVRRVRGTKHYSATATDRPDGYAARPRPSSVVPAIAEPIWSFLASGMVRLAQGVVPNNERLRIVAVDVWLVVVVALVYRRFVRSPQGDSP